jgi:hypothetical protein
MNVRKHDEAIRYIVEARWIEGAQGQSGFYSVLLNCGHAMGCSPAFLSAAMLCLDCLEENK